MGISSESASGYNPGRCVPSPPGSSEQEQGGENPGAQQTKGASSPELRPRWVLPQGMCHPGAAVSPHTIPSRMTSHRWPSPGVTAGRTKEAWDLKNTSLLKIESVIHHAEGGGGRGQSNRVFSHLSREESAARAGEQRDRPGIGTN